LRHLLRATVIAGSVIGVIFVVGWLFLASSIFSGPRTALVENTLARQIGQPIRIDGDIGLTPGRTLHIFAEDVVLPSPSMENRDLGAIGTLAFDLPVESLWNGRPSLSNIVIDGVRLGLVVDETGLSSWQFDTAGAVEQETDEGTPPDLSALFADPNLEVSNVSVLYQDARNGLDLDLALSALSFDLGDAESSRSIQGAGTLNGQALTLSSNVQAMDSFDASLEFDEVSIVVAGDRGDSGMEADVSVDMAELGQLLDILKLNRVLEGTGHIRATLKSSSGVNKLEDLDLLVELDGGQSVGVTGQVGEFGNLDDVSMITLVRLYPEGAEPEPTKKRRDLKLVAVEMVIEGIPGGIPQRSMVIETNGFSLDTAGEGPPPITVSQVGRTADGKLKLGSVALRIGPPATPYLILAGTVDDALQLDEVSAEGQIAIPTISLLQPLIPPGNHPLGEFDGVFNLEGNLEKFTLTNLQGSAINTELWDLNVSGTIADVLKFQDIDLNVDVSTDSGADVLAALDLSPVNVGAVNLGVELTSAGTDWNAATNIQLAESELQASVDLDDALTNPVLRGRIESDLIRLDDFRNIVAAGLQLRKLNADAPAEAEPVPEKKMRDGREVLPLVLPETSDQGPLRDVTLEPIGRAILLSGMDMDIDVDLRKIDGTKGISSLATELVLQDKALTLGPVAFDYGGGSFDVTGSMDLANEDHIFNLAGTAGGWQLDDLLGGLNFKKGASGTLYTNFDVSGKTDSVKGFISSMSGNAYVSMRNGSIETRLLDLAGLGVLPWLFSDKKGKVAPIACLNAPLSLAGGKVTTRQTALETDLVQVVVYGGLNIDDKTLDLNIQPRKVGEPLSRSPWPVSVSGPLAKPNIKVKDGPRKLKRKDGATQMPAQRKPCVPDILQLQ